MSDTDFVPKALMCLVMFALEMPQAVDAMADALLLHWQHGVSYQGETVFPNLQGPSCRGPSCRFLQGRISSMTLIASCHTALYCVKHGFP